MDYSWFVIASLVFLANAAVTWVVAQHFHEKTMKALALRVYQSGLISAKDLPDFPDMGHRRMDDDDDEPAKPPYQPRAALEEASPEYIKIFEQVRGKC